MLLTIKIPESERTPLVNWLLNLVAEQKQVIENQEETIADLQKKVERLEEQLKSLDEELKAAKKLKSQPKIRPSTLNQEKKTAKEGEKRAGSEKRSKKTSFVPDEERLIEPEELPEGATFNGYREYDVQDLIIQRHNIRFLLAEYVTAEGKTIVGKLPPQYQGHYGPTLIAFTLYQHHQCRVPQTLILEELRELGVDICAGQVNRILIENKESFHREQEQVFQVGLETAEYIHTDDTGARQFAILVHALCWVHAERALRRLSGNTSCHRQNIEEMQQLLWDYYRQLQGYPENPTAQSKIQLEEAFEQVFGRCYLHHASLNQVLMGFRERKAELLAVLDCPQLPLHNNEAESDLREYVTRRKISGGTRSEAGRRARDTFVGLKKTCRKLGISFWHFLISRLRGDGQIPPLPDVIRAKALAVT